MDTIGANLQAVRERVARAAIACGRRAQGVALIAVSKGCSADAVADAYAHGQRAFGESYAQEALAKIAALQDMQLAISPPESRPESIDAMQREPAVMHSAQEDRDATASDARGHSSGVASPQGPLLRPPESRIGLAQEDYDATASDARGHSSGVASPQGPLLRPPEWHFIGPIQSNKTRLIAENFAWVHSVDRLKIAERLSEARSPALAPLQVCLQVNIGNEPTKSGVDPRDALALARTVAALPRLTLRGLMTVPPATDDQALQRRYFAQLRALRDELAAAGLSLDTLSMGMSDDLEAAIAEGATLVRVGTAIFGQRVRR